MYTNINFKTKKALKQAVNDWNNHVKFTLGTTTYPPHPVTVFQPNADLTGANTSSNGKVYLEGPHYPAPHTWYAQAWLKDGIVIKVK